MAYQYEEFKRDVYKLTDINLDLYKERQMKRRIESLIARKGFDGFESFIVFEVILYVLGFFLLFLPPFRLYVI